MQHTNDKGDQQNRDGSWLAWPQSVGSWQSLGSWQRPAIPWLLAARLASLIAVDNAMQAVKEARLKGAVFAQEGLGKAYLLFQVNKPTSHSNIDSTCRTEPNGVTFLVATLRCLVFKLLHFARRKFEFNVAHPNATYQPIRPTLAPHVQSFARAAVEDLRGRLLCSPFAPLFSPFALLFCACRVARRSRIQGGH
jgi:hypothetical protein